MSSTFMGLETSKRGMNVQQVALSVLGHNVANANTDGYTRQRVNLTQTSPFPPVGFDKPYMPGQIGTGVQAGSIQRIRESFLDIQFRGDNSKLGYYNSRSDALTKMEDIMNEPSDQGLSKTMDRFWQSLQDLSTNPQNSGTRSVVLERGKAVAETFNYLSSSLSGIQGDLQNQIDVETQNVNSLLDQIQNVNKQIADVEPHGMLPNDLYDERDRLLDKLSGLVSIKVTYSSSGGNSLPSAEGKVSIDLLDENGSVIQSGRVIDGNDINSKPNYLTANYDAANGNLVSSIKIGNNTVNASAFKSVGKLRSLIDSYGSVDTSSGKAVISGSYPTMLQNLNDMANAFANQFNQVFSANGTYNTQTPPTQGGYFFTDGTNQIANQPTGSAAVTDLTTITAANISINSNITINDITAANAPVAGDGSNATLLANVLKTNKFTIGNISNTTIDSFYQGVIGGMGVKSQEAERLSSNSQTLVDSVNQNRLSVSGVSLDEEMTDMVKYQHAYNASARMITVIDEMLDKIINSMGTVGR
ncbi:flagellar hook-associated protein FlgK [Bacillus sp. RG28]|uniref:Flagellar hook-associated protein 1 n=1 Tax=Gottfriedia endophytica TaxID=2820819 RepID=A0A940NK22_9BACI|nr:flagellar hook-associated protein FlgK [Gottfriedia endophytica]MBP0726744.1 flagellar hook-associated protein FlgK [Gottfriedia endophytica]